MYGGLEYTWRDLDVPFLQQLPPPVFGFAKQTADWYEQLGRAYVFWTPHEWLALRAEYQYERIKRDEDFTFGIKKSETHKVPLGFDIFCDFGLSLSATTTYFDQDGDFELTFPGNFVSGDQDFWLVDASISYRLPKRYGFISVGASNLFDRKFNFEDTDPDSPSIRPERQLFVRATISFP